MERIKNETCNGTVRIPWNENDFFECYFEKRKKIISLFFLDLLFCDKKFQSTFLFLFLIKKMFLFAFVFATTEFLSIFSLYVQLFFICSDVHPLKYQYRTLSHCTYDFFCPEKVERLPRSMISPFVFLWFSLVKFTNNLWAAFLTFSFCQKN